MILGRPINLWLGLSTAGVGALTVTLIALGFDANVVGIIAGAWGGVIGAGIALVAGQPPTVTPGSTVNIQTPSGETNRTVTV